MEKKLDARSAEQAEQEDGGDDYEEGLPEADSKVDAALFALKSEKDALLTKKLQKKRQAANKSSSKRKGGGDDEPEMLNKPVQGLEECLEFEPLIHAYGRSSTKDSREKHCLDDFIGALGFARRNLTVAISDEEAERSKRFLISLFLELSWRSCVAVNGKLYKSYSAFREEATKVFYSAHQRLRVGERSYDPLLLAQNLMNMVQTASVASLVESNHGLTVSIWFLVA